MGRRHGSDGERQDNKYRKRPKIKETAGERERERENKWSGKADRNNSLKII